MLVNERESVLLSKREWGRWEEGRRGLQYWGWLLAGMRKRKGKKITM